MDYNLLKKAIESSNLSVSEICKKIGIDRTTFYSNLENRNMKIDVLEKICVLIKVDISIFLNKLETNEILMEPNESYGNSLVKKAQDLIKGIENLEKENKELKLKLKVT